MNFIVSLVIVILGQRSLAGNFVGNGGAGYFHSQRLYLLDFFESHLTPSIPEIDHSSSTESEVDHFHYIQYKKKIMTSFDLSEFPVEKMTNLLLTIRSKDAVLSNSLLETLNHLQWQFIQESLGPVRDINSSVLLNNKKVVQLAARRGQSVFIDQNLWKLLPDVHQVGLVLHELIYATLNPNMASNAFRTREITRYFFSPAFQSKTEFELHHFINEDLPISKNRLENSSFILAQKSVYEVQSTICQDGGYLYGIKIYFQDGLTGVASLCKRKGITKITESNRIGNPRQTDNVIIKTCKNEEQVIGLKIGFDKDLVSANPIQSTTLICLNNLDFQFHFSTAHLLEGKSPKSEAIVFSDNTQALFGFAAALNKHEKIIGFSLIY